MASKKQRFRWTHRPDDVLIRELFLFEPWSTSEGSKERGLRYPNIKKITFRLP